MVGCWPLGAIERGAFGFSNEKSFTYWARTPICGIAACGWGPPLVVDMLVSGPRAGVRGLANTGSEGRTMAAPAAALGQ